MNNQLSEAEILKQAIERAQANGMPHLFSDDEDEWQRLEDCRMWVTDKTYMAIIFSFPFAQAFWSNDSNNIDWKADDEAGITHRYHFHLQQLAIAEDRLQYIAQFI